MSNQNVCNYWKCASRLGLFFVVLFVICFSWYYIRPQEQELHLKLFKMAYLGFNEMNLWSFILGAVQSYIWAYIVVALWLVLGCCPKRVRERQ